MIHQWIVEMLMCTCNWLNMKQTILLPSSWFLPWPPQSQRNCRMQDCGSLSLQTQTSCCLSPQCFQRTSAPKEKKTNIHHIGEEQKQSMSTARETVNQLLLRWLSFTSREKLLCNDYFRYRKIFVTLRFSQTLQIFLARTCK